MYSFTCSTPTPSLRYVSSASIELVDERAGGRVLLDRVLPQVAHHAAPRALAAGQEDGGHLDDPAVGGPLRFDEHALVPPRVERPARRPLREHEAIALRTRRVGSLARRSSGVQREEPLAIRALAAAEPGASRLRGGDAVLEPPLREHRHVEAR